MDINTGGQIHLSHIHFFLSFFFLFFFLKKLHISATFKSGRFVRSTDSETKRDRGTSGRGRLLPKAGFEPAIVWSQARNSHHLGTPPVSYLLASNCCRHYLGVGLRRMPCSQSRSEQCATERAGRWENIGG